MVTSRTSCRAAASAALTALLLALAGTSASQQPEFDLLIIGGSVLDGTLSRAVRADVGVKGGVIARVGRLRGQAAVATIDATGRIVAPGFIDVHTHADDPADTPLLENFVRMGVTTVVAGNCGSSAERIGAELDAIRRTGIATNFA